MKKYDVCIIGGGPSGYAAAMRAVDFKKKVLLIEKKRIGGAYSASPVLAGNNLYFGSHEGKVTVIQPGTEPKIVAENQLDGKIMASPAIVDDSLILRTDKALYRID